MEFHRNLVWIKWGSLILALVNGLLVFYQELSKTAIGADIWISILCVGMSVFFWILDEIHMSRNQR